MTVGERITMIRKEKGLSQNRLAHLAGMSQTGISAIERGINNPTYETLSLIADAMGVPISYIMEYEKAAPENRDDLRRQFIITFDCLSKDAQAEALRYLRFLASQVPPRGE